MAEAKELGVNLDTIKKFVEKLDIKAPNNSISSEPVFVDPPIEETIKHSKENRKPHMPDFSQIQGNASDSGNSESTNKTSVASAMERNLATEQQDKKQEETQAKAPTQENFLEKFITFLASSLGLSPETTEHLKTGAESATAGASSEAAIKTAATQQAENVTGKITDLKPELLAQIKENTVKLDSQHADHNSVACQAGASKQQSQSCGIA